MQKVEWWWPGAVGRGDGKLARYGLEFHKLKQFCGWGVGVGRSKIWMDFMPLNCALTHASDGKV